jgi:sugar lactone lactonase YvrE
LLLLAATLSACQQPAPSATPTRELTVALGLGAAHLLTWTPTVHAPTAADVDHVDVTLADGSGPLATQAVPAANIGLRLSFTGLVASTTYHVSAVAYASAAESAATKISVDAASKVDLVVPAVGNPAPVVVPVKLVDQADGAYTPAVTTLAGNLATMPFGSADGTGSAAQFANPRGIAVDAAGTVYVADTGNSRIRKITAAGVVTTLAGSSSGALDGTGPAAHFNTPWGIAVGPDGTVYVADTNNHCIRKVTPAGDVTTLAGDITTHTAGATDGTGPAARLNFPTGLAVGPDGTVYVADGNNNCIRKVTPAGAVTTLAGNLATHAIGNADGTGAGAGFNFPVGLAADQAGNVYVADSQNRCIRKITATGVVTTLAGDITTGAAGNTDGTGASAHFSSPMGIALDAEGAILVGDHANHCIRKVTPTGVVTTFAGNVTARAAGNVDGSGLAAQFNLPAGVALDANGDVYVADYNNNCIRKVVR